MTGADLEAFPLCRYFLSGYLENCGDATNFPPNEGPGVFERYEEVFRSGLDTLKLEKEALRRRSEFNFDRATPANLESAIGVLRAVSALRMEHFSAITLLDPPGADLKCERDGRIVCCEVKTITKQSKPRKQGSFFTHHPYEIHPDQLYEKIVEEIERARNQLKLTAAQLGGSVTMYVCVCNWFDQAIYLTLEGYQYIVNRLEKDKLEGEDAYRESLKSIDAVFFVPKAGTLFWFVSDALRASGFGGDIQQTAVSGGDPEAIRNPPKPG